MNHRSGRRSLIQRFKTHLQLFLCSRRPEALFIRCSKAPLPLYLVNAPKAVAAGLFTAVAGGLNILRSYWDRQISVDVAHFCLKFTAQPNVSVKFRRRRLSAYTSSRTWKPKYAIQDDFSTYDIMYYLKQRSFLHVVYQFPDLSAFQLTEMHGLMVNPSDFQENYVNHVTKLMNAKRIYHGVVASNKVTRTRNCMIRPETFVLLNCADSEEKLKEFYDSCK